MKLNKGMLLVLVAGMSFSGMLQAVSGRYYNTRIQSVEAMLNGKKAMDYAVAQKNLNELRIALKNEAKNSDRYKRFANAEKRFAALPARAMAPAAVPGAQALPAVSAAEEAAALAAAEIADEAEQPAVPGLAAPDAEEQDMQGLPAPEAQAGDAGSAAPQAQSTMGASAGRDAAAAAAGIDLAQIEVQLNQLDHAITNAANRKAGKAKDKIIAQAQAIYDSLVPTFQQHGAILGNALNTRMNVLETRLQNLQKNN